MKKIDKNYFPGWVRKSISFTIDDGNLEMDKKFIDIVAPAGIKGTFNISNFHFDKLDEEGYREFYRGYEIANHVRLHPYAFSDGVEYDKKTGDLPEHAETATTVYEHEEDGVYLIERAKGWRKITDCENYVRLTRECTELIKKVFPEQKKLGFVWPFGLQNNAELFDALTKEGFYGLRQTGGHEDQTGFALPEDRNHWSYNANHLALLRVAELYRDYPDDGELKTFIFGVHSVDFERSENWCDLAKFADEFGNRPETYWYATNVEIFDYEDAVSSVEVAEEYVKNPSDITLYITVDGKRVTLPPHSTYNI